MKGGLTRRTVIASGLLAVIIGAAFGVLVLSIVDLNRVEQRSRRSEEVLVVATLSSGSSSMPRPACAGLSSPEARSS